MSLTKNLPNQITIYYVDKDKYKRSCVALYNFKGHIHIVDELSSDAEVYKVSVVGITRTGLKTRDVLTDGDYMRCGLGTTITITQE